MKMLNVLIAAPVLVALLGVEVVKAQEPNRLPEVRYLNITPHRQGDEIHNQVAFPWPRVVGDTVVQFSLPSPHTPLTYQTVYVWSEQRLWRNTISTESLVLPHPLPDPLPPPIAGYGNLEVPADGSFQNGIGYVSGWVCFGDLQFYLNDNLVFPTLGAERGDTSAVCGDSRNGFVMPVNWSLLGDGQHRLQVVSAGVLIQEARFTVNTLGEEFVRGASGECTIADFPSTGESATVRWQESQQGFVLTDTE